VLPTYCTYFLGDISENLCYAYLYFHVNVPIGVFLFTTAICPAIQATVGDPIRVVCDYSDARKIDQDIRDSLKRSSLNLTRTAIEINGQVDEAVILFKVVLFVSVHF